MSGGTNMIGSGKILRTELDFLVESIRTMRELRQNSGYQVAQSFQTTMEEYFGLGIDMRSSFVYDELLRLADTPAGTTIKRDDKVLERIHSMKPGDKFSFDGKACLLIRHIRMPDMRDGFLEYSDVGERKTLDYNSVWTLVHQGRITFD
jgi:hypothetical protein